MGSLRVREQSYPQGNHQVVPEGAQARHLHGQPGRQHALEFVRWKEKGARQLLSCSRAYVRVTDNV